VSTLREIRGLLPLVEEKVVNEVRRKLGGLASDLFQANWKHA